MVPPLSSAIETSPQGVAVVGLLFVCGIRDQMLVYWCCRFARQGLAGELPVLQLVGSVPNPCHQLVEVVCMLDMCGVVCVFAWVLLRV